MALSCCSAIVMPYNADASEELHDKRFSQVSKAEVRRDRHAIDPEYNTQCQVCALKPGGRNLSVNHWPDYERFLVKPFHCVIHAKLFTKENMMG